MSKLKLHPADVGFLALVADYILICWTIVAVTGHASRFMPLMYLGTAAQMSVTFLMAYVLYRLARAAWILLSSLRAQRSNPYHATWIAASAPPPRNDGPFKLILSDLKQGPLRREMLTRALPVFIAFIFFFSTFTSMKFLITDIRPFAWDTTLMQADRAIHFGVDPWRILQPVFGYPPVTKAIAFLYILWLPVFFLVLYWQLFRFRDDRLRMRFFYTFVMTWAVNGTFLAIYFSSAGPCYFLKAVASDYYAPLMDYLRHVNEHYTIYSVYTQDLLWQNYSDRKNILGGGISAFPSVHVATAFLFVLLARHVNKYCFAAFLVFFAAILIGSVHLGWHYAVDGYAAIITTALLWALSGKLIKVFYETGQSA